MRCVDGFDDRIFGEEAGEWREAGVRQCADQHRNVGDRQVFAQPAHFAHVLLVVHRHDHRPRAQEQYRFEKGVRHEMEDAN